MHLSVVGITGLYPFDENGPAIVLYAMLKGMLLTGGISSDKMTMELLIGMSHSKDLNLDQHPLLNVPMVPVLRNPKSLNGFQNTINGCSKFVSKVKKADMIFYNSPPIDPIAFTFPFISRLARKKQIYYLHGSLINERVNSVTRRYFHLIARLGFLDRVIIPLESFKKVVSKLICPYERILAIPECVVTPWYEDSDKIRLEGDPVLMYAGRLAEVKRVDVLLKAFSTITSQYPSARLYIAGSGPLEEFLKELSSKLDISEKTTFLGHLQHKRLRILYRSADMFILPSDAEFMSISLLEAMASKCPVVATDVAATEVIENGRNGLVFPHGDSAALTKSVLKLADDETLRKKLSGAAYLTVKEKFDYRVVASKLVKEINNTLTE